ncbi:BTB/POZ and MATH domain-containing protein 1 [Carex littledalei]|uniref:BTB/POZ and MATH domain-containing protein 1 n=1 Tax=Carex littledalei TaxID=544730 RepID=A0A833W0F8_9POAL|nr:BTB/POZ and MATH domain-containing protein 1 [Carex littledalei]
MGSFAEGLYTFETKEVSTFAPQGRINEELIKIKSYERMYSIKYGPFTLGDIEWEIRLYPYGELLIYYLCLLDDAVAVKKYGYISLVQDHSSNGDWKIHTWIKLNEEKDFNVRSLAEGLGLPMVRLTYFSKSEQEKYSKDDCFLNKFVLWVIPDDSRKTPPNAVCLRQPHQPEFISPNLSMPSALDQPNEPETVISPPSDLISTLLLTGDFADIIFLVKKYTFAAHRCVLAARSSVFRSELLALQKDINMSMKSLCVSVQHIDGLTFKHLLHFIYTNTLPPDFEEVTPPERYHRMFVAAHRFKIEGLKLICEKKLTKVVADTMITAIDLSEYDECGLLKIVQHD